MGFLSDEIQKANPKRLVLNYQGNMEDKGFVNTGVGLMHISDLREFTTDVRRYLDHLPTALCYHHGYLRDVIPLRDDWEDVSLTLQELTRIRNFDQQQLMERFPCRSHHS